MLSTIGFHGDAIGKMVQRYSRIGLNGRNFFLAAACLAAVTCQFR